MIKIETLMKLDLRVELVNGENIVVASENGKRLLLSIEGTSLIPEKEIESGARVS
jgi:hypothetical protein